MKRNIITLLVALFAMTQTMAQTYDNLWKQAQTFRQKDQPKSEIGVMKKIISKATASKDYGQLLAAELRQTVLWNDISSDSLTPAVRRMEAEVQRISDPVLKSVRYAALGKFYRENPYGIEVDEKSASAYRENYDANMDKSKEYFLKALAQPELLAKHYSTEYVPLTLKGVDGTTFHNDMLHLIGFEADCKEAYQLMHTYYNKVGNRGAACLCAFQITQKDRLDDVKEVRKSKYLNTIDSLIHVYQDIPEAGELAVEHFRFMEGATDAKPLDKLNYINYALNHWGGWSRMNVLRNAQKRLTEPMFSLSDMPQVLRPTEKKWVKLNVRNLQNVKVSISRVNITADNDYDVSDEATYKMLLKKTSALHQKDFNKQFYGHPNYEEVKDSFEIGGNLPLGAYLMEVSSDNTSIAPQRKLFYVSNLAVMIQQLPDDKHRYVVVSATSGQPIAGAKIELYDTDYDMKAKKNKRVVHARLTTDADGEAYFKNVDGTVLISTNEDKFTPAKNIYLSRTRYYEQKENKTMVQLYTDRSIYRPGQTVHATAIVFRNEKGLDAKVFPISYNLDFDLVDANRKQVARKSAKTDGYGTASVDFELPQGGLTGQYHIEVNTTMARTFFRVEEYKRPTFEITFPKVNEKYTWGDTVVVKATAKTYAGVPVQGAKVEYKVTRRNQLWWWGARSAEEVVKKAEGTTREDGTFDVEIPLEALTADGKNVSDDAQSMAAFMRKARFFNFDVSAVVTDLSGESHEGEMSLPLGTKPTAFSVDLSKRIEADSLKAVTFSYRNASGMEIASSLKYRIDQGKWADGYANVPMPIDSLMSGVHELEAICGVDTLQQKFTVFSIKDTHPMEPTTEWYYQTADVFPRDGKPVYVQVGSSENGAHIVYSIIAGNKLLEKGAWELGDSIVTLPLTYKPEYASGIVINYSFVKEGKCYTRTIRIARPLPEKKLNIKWKTFRNRLTPGQKEEWTLNITTPDGKPAKAQLMSVLYDKSLDNLASHRWDLSLGFSQMLPNCYWRHNLSYRPFGLSGTYPTKYYDEKELEVDHFDESYFSHIYANSNFAYLTGGVSDRTVEAVRMEKHSAVHDEGRIIVGYGMARKQAAPMMASRANSDGVAMDVAEDIEVAAPAPVSEKEEKVLDNVQVRENLNETAFFYPVLETDSKGNVAIKFTLPESVTTWKFMGLAHDKEMRNAMLDAEAVAQKTVMVQPNMPRFLREGDKATIVTKIFNTSDKKVGGNARMQIIDPETNKVVWQKNAKYNVDANGSATLSFDVEGLKEGVYINKVVASGNGYSDGEQHYLPVLSNRELVTNTLPITLTEKGVKDFDLSSLFAGKDGKSLIGKNGELDKNVADAKVTIEYANNPSWLMIQALPSLSNPTNDDNAISLMAAIYSNSIARHIMKSSPVIKQVVELWKKEQASNGASSSHASGYTASGKLATSLMSSLEKNQELKNLVLEETPWVMDADKESEQKAKLINYFDETQVASRLAAQIAKLQALQSPLGAFSWWKGMDGNRYVTTAVAKMMARLNQMIGSQSDVNPLLRSALSYLQDEAAKEVKEMKKREAELLKKKAEAENGSKTYKNIVAQLASIRPSEDAVDYLYILSLDGNHSSISGKKLNTSASSDKDYLLKKMADKNGEFTIYGKAIAAVVLARNGYKQQAADYLQSINEYSVYKPEVGRYFDTRKATYSWRDYKIPTQVAAIEAMKLLGEPVNEMQLWLLQSKRTQAWDTPVNTVDAVYAFLNGKEAVLEKTTENATIKLDGKVLSLPKATAGLGYVKISKQGTAKTLTIDKKNEGTSWGAVYAQFAQPSSKIASAESGIKVTRKIAEVKDEQEAKNAKVIGKNAKVIGKNAKIGDKVKVILTITADRDYDFVQIVDKRAACLEPVNQLSGYQWGLGGYISPKDYTTNFYFDRLSKGKHQVEMEYYVDRKGDYLSGTCTVQCAYSPEFGGRAEAYQMEVKE